MEFQSTDGSASVEKSKFRCCRVVAKGDRDDENQFGLKPKGLTFSYKRPYPEWYDLVALPINYRLPEFAKFTGQDSTSTIEHVSEYLTQLGEASVEEAHRVRSSPCPCQGQPSLGFHHY